MAVVNAVRVTKTVGDPNAEYMSLQALWAKSRAVCSGERYAKDYDNVLSRAYGNLLIPFSPSMTQAQYDFYKAEAELPGIVSLFCKMLVGGLLRKQPVLELPDNVPEAAMSWLVNEFGQDDSTLASFLDQGVYEELQTSRAWVCVDHPQVLNPEDLTPEQKLQLKPYPVLWKAESVINWHVSNNDFGKATLDRVIVRSYEEAFEDGNEFHPVLRDTVHVHELVKGVYQIRKFQRRDPVSAVPVVNGQQQADKGKTSPKFDEVDKAIIPLANGEPLSFIPAWPLNGMINPVEPQLIALIDKEVALYNKMSRRNHLLYGAATYTPIICSDMLDTDFDKVVSAGLGSWIKLGQEDSATILKTPTEALADYNSAIAAAIEELARMGIRMLSPESAQSGVALDIRNASQNAQLGTLNTKISNTMRQVICFMLNWRYDLELKISDIKFELSSDFNPTPLGADWLRLATEWYQSGLIPRTVWLEILKHNDMISPDYDDEEGKQEINADADLVMAGQASEYADKVSQNGAAEK